MKNSIRCFAAVLLFLSTFTSVAQSETASPDARLYKMFSKKEVAQMQENAPEDLAFWTYYLDHGYSVMAMPKGKGDDLPVVSIKDINSFNVLALKEMPQEVGNRYFRIKETGQLLALHSISEVKAKMNQPK